MASGHVLEKKVNIFSAKAAEPAFDRNHVSFFPQRKFAFHFQLVDTINELFRSSEAKRI